MQGVSFSGANNEIEMEDQSIYKVMGIPNHQEFLKQLEDNKETRRQLSQKKGSQGSNKNTSSYLLNDSLETND